MDNNELLNLALDDWREAAQGLIHTGYTLTQPLMVTPIAGGFDGRICAYAFALEGNPPPVLAVWQMEPNFVNILGAGRAISIPCYGIDSLPRKKRQFIDACRMVIDLLGEGKDLRPGTYKLRKDN